MKELGEYLKHTRVSNGVSLAEAAEDLELSTSQLENIESGNVRAFKDVYNLKQYVKQYAKYLGLNPEKVVDEFNGFLFEHTSKISLDDIKAAQKKLEDNEKKVISPYTKEYKEKSAVIISGLKDDEKMLNSCFRNEWKKCNFDPQKTYMRTGKIRGRTAVIVISFVKIGLMSLKLYYDLITKKSAPQLP
jgi:transcriptional regulator with XRE-family HTH domain